MSTALRPELDLGLRRVAAVLDSCGSPHRTFPAVHVAGTNGKGSTVALLTAALSACGAVVGTFVSPFLREPRDAVTVGGVPASAADWAWALAEVDAGVVRAGSDAGRLTTFEAWTCAAFLLFHRAAVDIAVVEVGVGGATDATNVLPPPLVAIIASISMDHVELLGPGLCDIARHKAGIIKRGGGIAVTVPGQHADVLAVLHGVALEQGVVLVEAPLAEGAPAASLALEGAFQLRNAGAAIAALRHLRAVAAAAEVSLQARSPSTPPPSCARLDDATIARGFSAVRWRGRLERVLLPTPSSSSSPSHLAFTLDGCHNAEAVDAVGAALALQATQAGASRVSLIYGCSASRDAQACLAPLLRALAGSGVGVESHQHRMVYVFTVPFSPPEGMAWVTAHTPQALVDAALAVAEAEGVGASTTAVACANLVDAIARVAAAEAGAGEGHVVFRACCGSLYLVSDVYRQLLSEH